MSDTVVAGGDGPRDRIGRYEIRGVLAQGGFGAVYRAYDPQLMREVVVRAVAAGAAAATERYLQTPRAAAELNHPNICPVLDVGTDGGRHFVVTPYLVGQTLAEALRAPAGLPPPRRAAALVRTLALAADHAHQKGVLHLDLKPSRVMLVRGGEPVILGFGRVRPGPIEPGAVAGTPAYMAPEQARAEVDRFGPHTDVWALGVILYELLTGGPPFRGEDLLDVMFRVVNETPPPPSAVRPGIDPRLDTIVGRAMARRPQDRFRTARELADALGDFLRSSSDDRADMATMAPADPPAPQTMAPGSPAAFVPPPRPVPPPARRSAPAPTRVTPPAAPKFESLPASWAPSDTAELPALGGVGAAMAEKARTVTRRAAVRYYSRMSPGRLFPLLVVLSAEQIAEVRQKAVKQAESAGFHVEPDSLLELEPVLPGCDCYPPRESLPVAPEPVTATFYVVPHVLGRVEGARVVVRQGGRILSEVPLDVKVRKQTIAVLCGLLSLAAPYLMMGLKSLKLDYESQKADGFPVYQRAAAWALENVRPEYAGFGLVGLAVVAYFAMRPKKRDVFWDIAPKPVK